MMTNKYQQFLKDNRGRIKEEFPELSNTERFVKLAEEWKKHKATLEEPAEPCMPPSPKPRLGASPSPSVVCAAKTANTGNSKYATEFYIARLVLTHGMFYI
jgi:hypothetical protein